MGTIWRVYEYDSNRPRLFGEYGWALEFAAAEKLGAEMRAGLYAEMGDDLEMQEAEEILGGGLLDPEEWVEEEETDDTVAARIAEKGPGGALWSEV